ncbi:MAG: hypothetical protein ACE5ID_06545, partial [Acidobacteriota bacterium]
MREARDASLAGRPLTLAARTIMVPLLVLLLGGCVAGRQRAPGFHSRPEGETAWRPPLRPFRADLRGRFRGPGGRARFRAGLGARPPDFRLDLFHPVSHQTLLSLGVVKGRLRAVWPAEGICLEAEGSPEIMEDLLAVRIHPEDLLPLLSGHFYRDEKIQILKYQTTDGSWQTVHGSVPHGRRVRVEGLDPAT